MIKKILFGLTLIAGLVSCKGDYDDWANPQHNDQSDPMDEIVFTVQPTVSTIDFATETSESIQLFTSNLPAEEYAVTIYSNESEVRETILADEEGKVSTDDLISAIEAVCGSGEENYEVRVQVATSIETEAEGSTIKVAKLADPFGFTAHFQLATGPSFDSDPVLYLTGSIYNWGGTTDDWVPLVPVWGNADLSWIVIYLHEGEEFKFAPQQGWGGDFGMKWDQVSNNIIDNAGMNPSGDNNIEVGNAGWYLITVYNPATGGPKTITFDKANVYSIGGSTAPAGWSADPANLFEIPTTESGKFVSPAYTADGEARMAVSITDPTSGASIDLWKTEFIVRDGQIQYRGNGGDQNPRVQIKAGQKCYLDFTKGTGSYK